LLCPVRMLLPGAYCAQGSRYVVQHVEGHRTARTERPCIPQRNTSPYQVSHRENPQRAPAIVGRSHGRCAHKVQNLP
jgi:hypothetical protein